MHTLRLSGVPCSCCFVHIAWWIRNRRFHTAWPYNRKNHQQLCLVRKLHFTTKWEGKTARSQFSSANGNVNKMVAQKWIVIQMVCTLICIGGKKDCGGGNGWGELVRKLPAALYLALSLAIGHHWCIFQSELISHQVFNMQNISWMMRRWFFQITSLIIHTTWLSLAWMSTQFVHDFAKPVGRGKLGLKSCSVNSAEAKWVDP